MKNTIKFFALAVVICGFSATSFAQSASATASGIITPAYFIAKTTDMNFGSVVPGAIGGNVILAPAGTTTVSGGVTKLAAGSGAISAAEFALLGPAAGATLYTVSLPNKIDITREGGTEIMVVNGFTVDKGALAVGGAGTLKVGATLNVGTVASNPAGTYSNPSGFQITVNFQ